MRTKSANGAKDTTLEEIKFDRDILVISQGKVLSRHYPTVFCPECSNQLMPKINHKGFWETNTEFKKNTFCSQECGNTSRRLEKIYNGPSIVDLFKQQADQSWLWLCGANK